ncbi:MAG: DUF4340 domain-containing protein [Sedimentisphaerales bacterium]|nr:DUF4340 domain-containing protein [Sedimentisphaerales bacterium]
MSNRKVTILGVVAAVMLAWAILQSHFAGPRRGESPATAFLIQGMPPIDRIGSIELGLGDKKVTLQRRGEAFVVAEKGDYPALAKPVNELVLDCLKIQTSERVTEDSRNFRALGVNTDDPNGPEAVVRFYRSTDSDEQPPELITGVVFGKRAESGGGQYVRRFDDNVVYLVEDPPAIRTGALEYVQQELFDADAVGKNRIARVQVIHPSDRYALTSDPNDNIVLENRPPDRSLKKYEAEQVWQALSALRFQEVKPLPQADPALDFSVTYQCFLKNAVVYQLDVAKQGENYYVKCKAGYTDKSIQALLEQRQQQKTDEQIQEGADKIKAYDQTVQFTQRHADWVYELSSWNGGKLTKKLEDLLEKPAQPEPAAAEPEATEPAAGATPPEAPAEANPPIGPQVAPVGQTPGGETPDAKTPAKETPDTPAPAGQTPAAETPAKETPDTPAP